MLAARIIDKISELAEWDQSSFSNGDIPIWNASTGKFEGGALDLTSLSGPLTIGASSTSPTVLITQDGSGKWQRWRRTSSGNTSDLDLYFDSDASEWIFQTTGTPTTNIRFKPNAGEVFLSTRLHVQQSSSQEGILVDYQGGGSTAIRVQGGNLDVGTACITSGGSIMTFGLGSPGATDYERIRTRYDSTAGYFKIYTEAGGAGVVRNIHMGGGNVVIDSVLSLATPLGIAYGGTGTSSASGGFDALAPTTTLGDLIYYGSSSNTRLAGNTTTTQMFLSQTGTGSVSAAPVWTALAASDIPSLDASKITSGTLTTARLGSGVADSSVFLCGDGTWTATLQKNNTSGFATYGPTLTLDDTADWADTGRLGAVVYRAKNTSGSSIDYLTLGAEQLDASAGKATLNLRGSDEAALAVLGPEGHRLYRTVVDPSLDDTGTILELFSDVVSASLANADQARPRLSFLRRDAEGGEVPLGHLQANSSYGLSLTGPDGLRGVSVNQHPTLGTNQLGFFGTIPIAQPSGDISEGLSSLGLISDPTLDWTYLTGVPSSIAYTDISNSFTVSQTIQTIGSTTNQPDLVLAIRSFKSGLSAGFGAKLSFSSNTTTGVSSSLADISTYWVTPTNGSQTSGIKLIAYYTSTGYEGLRIEGHSSGAAKIGFLGASAALRQTGDVGTALVTFGLMSGTPTFAAANITGTVSSGSLPSDVAYTDVANTFTVAQAISPTASSSGVPSLLSLTAPSNTGITASTEASLWNLTLGTQTWATGALSLQRFLRVRQPTIAFAGASTVTNAATLQIDGAPVAGTNATLTESAALRVLTGAATAVGLVVQGAASQSAAILSVQNSSGQSKFSVDNVGTISCGKISFSNNPCVDMAGWWTLTQGASGGVNFGSGHVIYWKSTSTNTGSDSGDVSLHRSAAGVVRVGNGSTGYGSLTLGNTDSGTGTAPTAITINHESSGTPSTAFGSTILFAAGSSTTAGQSQSAIQSWWADATHATRTGHLHFGTYYTSTFQEGLRIDSASDQARLAIGGSVTSGVRLIVNAGVSTEKILVVQGVSSQSGNYFECRNSGGSSLVDIDSTGNINMRLRSVVGSGNSNAISLWVSGSNYCQQYYNGTDDTYYVQAVGLATTKITFRNYDASNQPKFTLSPTGGGRFGVNNISPSGTGHFVVGGASEIGLIVQGASSQSGNLQEWQNSSGTALSSVTSNGTFLGIQGSHTTAAFALGSTAYGLAYHSGGTGIVSGSAIRVWYGSGYVNIGSNGLGFHSSSDASDSQPDAALTRVGAAALKIANSSTGYGSLTLGVSDSGTTTTPTALTLNHESSGTPAAGFGSTLLFAAGSSTTAGQSQSSLVSSWVDATHSTRTGRYTISTYYTSTAQEAIRIDSASDQARIGLGSSIVSGQRVTISTGVSTDKGLVIQGVSSQSGNLLELQNSGSSVLTKFDSNGFGFPICFSFPIAVGVAATTGTDVALEVPIPFNGRIVKAQARAKTAPTGQNLIFDINLNGTSIWNTTQANRIQIAANAQNGSQTTFDTTSVSAGDVLSIDVDQVGSGTAGQDIVVILTILAKNI